MEVLILILVVAVLPIFVAYKITSGKGRGGGLGILLGVLLGWIGVIITLFLSNKREEAEVRAAIEVARQRQAMYRECPHCKEQMRRDASTCPHCQRDSRAWEQREGHWWSQTQAGEWFWLDEQAGEWKPASVPPAEPVAALPELSSRTH
jgi:hypothetical protein